jgi:spore coat protein U-like protein
MNRIPRIFRGLLAAAIFVAAPFGHAQAATINAAVSVNLVKPFELTAKQDLDFGQIMMGSFTGSRNVSISQAGAITCAANLTCTGLAKPAIYNLRGTNKTVGYIRTAASNLVNSANGTSITFTPSAPASVMLTSSGAPGNDFNVGGTIAIPSTATGGLYSGDIEVTVDYQ